MRKTARQISQEAWSNWRLPPKISVADWALENRRFGDTTASPGPFRFDKTPLLRGILDCINDPDIRSVVVRKSAQVGWTDGVVNNYLGYLMDTAPPGQRGAVVLFPQEESAAKFVEEKLEPMIESTPVLAARIDIRKARDKDNRRLFKRVNRVMMRFVGSNSPSNVKSTSAPIGIVEEPDDCNVNVKGQGDTIELLKDRNKTFPRRKFLIGGTPTVRGASTIDDDFIEGDQRYAYVPCHECGERHILHWDNVRWEVDESANHAIYGSSLPETAWYECPHCQARWDDWQRGENVRQHEWIAHAEFKGVASFSFWEAYSLFEGSKLQYLVVRYLKAKHKLDSEGDESEIIAFWNACRGESYEYQTDVPDSDELNKRAEDYRELTVPMDGVVATVGVDVQHDRVALIIRAWGLGEESWLVYWGEIHGNPLDRADAVWEDLEAAVFSRFEHESGGVLEASAVTIDCSDGVTAENVYSWVREMGRRYSGTVVMAGKGWSQDYGTKEVFTKPKPAIDLQGRKKTKASRFGLRPYMVGTHRAKDIILENRLTLVESVSEDVVMVGRGPGRFHFYRGARADYTEQLVSEIKAPSRTVKKLVYRLKSGVRNEGLDCEVMALHAARALNTHTRRPEWWALKLQQILDGPRFAQEVGGDKPKKKTRSMADIGRSMRD
ncbi:MAG: phage terminase large subunit family protein [Halioglobus sp.]